LFNYFQLIHWKCGIKIIRNVWKVLKEKRLFAELSMESERIIYLICR